MLGHLSGKWSTDGRPSKTVTIVPGITSYYKYLGSVRSGNRSEPATQRSADWLASQIDFKAPAAVGLRVFKCKREARTLAGTFGERERFITEQATLAPTILVGPPEVRWGNFKEVSAWGKWKVVPMDLRIDEPLLTHATRRRDLPY
jgi:hypothetical protein